MTTTPKIPNLSTSNLKLNFSTIIEINITCGFTKDLESVKISEISKIPMEIT